MLVFQKGHSREEGLLDDPVRYSHSDLGGVGLLQVPTARHAPDGDFHVNFSHVSPYNRTSISAQVLSWLEGTVRYTAITNRKYSNDEEFSGDQSYKDRGFDVKVRLSQESKLIPEVSLAMHDFAGTGLFSTEYILGSKRFFNWDFTLGLAWGNGGARGGIKNPFTLISNRFKDRNAETGEGGDVSFGNYFSGEEVSVVGGVEYAPSGSDWVLKVEFDGNDYQSEGLDNNFNQVYPINVGAGYRINDLFSVQLGLERGDTVMAGIQLGMNFGSEEALMPKFDKKPESILQKSPDLRSVKDVLSLDEEAFGLRDRLLKEKVNMSALKSTDTEVTIYAKQSKYRDQAEAVGRVTRVLINELPSTLSSVRYINQEANLNTNQVVVYTGPFEKAVVNDSQVGFESSFMKKGNAPIGYEEGVNKLVEYPSFDWRIRPVFSPSFGAPEAFVIYQLWVKLAADIQFNDNWSLNNVMGIDVLNNYDELEVVSESVLPHVRSDVAKYAEEGSTGIKRMQSDYIWKPSKTTFARISGGLFESMYGGVGGELLYRSVSNRLAMGIDANYVKQRDYNQLFEFRDYTVVTGHLSVYYDMPISNTLAKVSAGRYLAGDVGTTIDLSRKFKTGVVMGGWTTFTDVSSEDFGEGSFDKGIYIKFPLDLFFVESRKESLTASWRPITRDGGQKLIMGNQLYSLISN
ncbi:YjbH domain-containing protein [Litoribacillus peritrichatus]|uniref:YjbH domain-containing protein n=2 Tax=Litoribacillus peritrichatus TaxID=718191 RepID=A0ABP7LXP8_9GAMM